MHSIPPSSSENGPGAARVAASTLFYPAAALYGAIVLPWSVLSLIGIATAPSALASPAGHAHEMLLGYALGVVAGNQLPVSSRSRAVLLLALWIVARVAFLARGAPAALAFDALFGAVLAWHVVPRLFVSAKKLRNQGLPLALTALCVAAAAYDIALLAGGAVSLRSVETAIVLVLATLMLFMGGRLIGPAAAGQFHRQGRVLGPRVQPRIEGALLATMAVAVASAAWPSAAIVVRGACAVAGVLALVRLARWRLWSCRRRPDLLSLGVGYAWIGVGLIAIAASDAGQARTAALHVITVGALGTLTCNVMGYTTLIRARQAPANARTLPLATALIGVATIARVAAAFAASQAAILLVLAAGCWALALLAVSVLLLRTSREARDRRRDSMTSESRL